jgi:hypothetical protein
MCCNLAALSIAVLYYAWRDGYTVTLRKREVLRERVAYMLWTAAQRTA